MLLERAEEVAMKYIDKPGSWLLRVSNSGCFAFTVVVTGKRIVHYRVNRVGNDYVLLLGKGEERRYALMSEMFAGAEKELGLKDAIAVHPPRHLPQFIDYLRSYREEEQQGVK